jgi:hypothetical protein
MTIGFSKTISKLKQGPGGSMSSVVGLPNNTYKPITNARGFAFGFVNYKKGALDSQFFLLVCQKYESNSDQFFNIVINKVPNFQYKIWNIISFIY